MASSVEEIGKYLMQNHKSACKVKQPTEMVPFEVITCDIRKGIDDILNRFLDSLKAEFRYMYVNKSDTNGYVTTYGRSAGTFFADQSRIAVKTVYGSSAISVCIGNILDCKITAAMTNSVSFEFRFKGGVTFIKFCNDTASVQDYMGGF